MNIGFVGYSGAPYNKSKGLELVNKAFDDIKKKYSGKDIAIVSGATLMGIPQQVYEVAIKQGYKTIGVMCKDGYTCKLFPVDELYAVGNSWGDESQTFIDKIDVLYRIGGGPQSMKEVKMARSKGIPVIEFELPILADQRKSTK